MQQKQLSGIFYAAFASLWWGVVGTIFFKFVSFASFIELTVHRTIWTAVLLILTTSFYKKWPEFNQIFKRRKNTFRSQIEFVICAKIAVENIIEVA